MTRIDFHFNAPDKLAYTCRLARKAYLAGSQVVIHGEAGLIHALDEALWTFAPLDFVPHCYATDALASATPVLLTASATETPHHDVLVNLGPVRYDLFSRFERLIEVVDTTAEDREAGRGRWRFYQERGYPLTSFDLAKESK